MSTSPWTLQATCNERHPACHAAYVPWVAAALAALALGGALAAVVATPGAHDLAPRPHLASTLRATAI
jgi:hypothetical protein